MWYDMSKINEPDINSLLRSSEEMNLVINMLLIEDEQDAFRYFENVPIKAWSIDNLAAMCMIFDKPISNEPNKMYNDILDYMTSIRLYNDSDLKITKFRGDYNFLSTMYECDIRWLDLDFDCLESAIAASMTLDRDIQELIATMEVEKVQQLSKVFDVRDDWDDIKIPVVTKLTEIKFTSNIGLYNRLLATGGMEIIEGNDFYETFWGMCNGEGRNEYGKILMRLRRDLRNHITKPN